MKIYKRRQGQTIKSVLSYFYIDNTGFVTFVLHTTTEFG